MKWKFNVFVGTYLGFPVVYGSYSHTVKKGIDYRYSVKKNQSGLPE